MGVIGSSECDLSVLLRVFFISSRACVGHSVDCADKLRTMRRRATTLVELMIALLVLSVCAGALLAGIGQAGSRAGIASEKVIILTAVKNQMDIARQAGRNGNLTAGTNSGAQSLTGLPYPVNFTRTASAVAGEPGLFAVRVVATWAGADNKRTGTMQLDTLVYNEP